MPWVITAIVVFYIWKHPFESATYAMKYIVLPILGLWEIIRLLKWIFGKEGREKRKHVYKQWLEEIVDLFQRYRSSSLSRPDSNYNRSVSITNNVSGNNSNAYRSNQFMVINSKKEVEESVSFTGWIDAVEFQRIVLSVCNKYKRRIKKVDIKDYIVRGWVITQSKLNTWSFTIVFDTSSENAKYSVSPGNWQSQIPYIVAQDIRDEIKEGILEEKRIKEQQEQIRFDEYWKAHIEERQRLIDNKKLILQQIKDIETQYGSIQSALYAEYMKEQKSKGNCSVRPRINVKFQKEKREVMSNNKP